MWFADDLRIASAPARTNRLEPLEDRILLSATFGAELAAAWQNPAVEPSDDPPAMMVEPAAAFTADPGIAALSTVGDGSDIVLASHLSGQALVLGSGASPIELSLEDPDGDGQYRGTLTGLGSAPIDVIGAVDGNRYQMSWFDNGVLQTGNGWISENGSDVILSFSAAGMSVPTGSLQLSAVAPGTGGASDEAGSDSGSGGDVGSGNVQTPVSGAYPPSLFGRPTGINPIPPSVGNQDLLRPISDYPIAFDGAYTSLWTADQVRAIERTPATTAPIVSPTEPDDLLPQFNMTDHWVVKDRDGSVARINGYYMIVGLFYPADVQGRVEQGNTNTYGYLLSADGENWSLGGVLVDPRDDAVPGNEFFSGSTMYDQDSDTLYVFTTNVSDQVASPSVPQPVQEIGLTRLRPVAIDGGVDFEMIDSQVVLTPDDRFYVTPENARTGDEVYGFRDPVFFKDPRSGEEFLTFTANLANEPGDNSGVVGIARANGGDLTDWQLLPPVLAAVDVNEQLERPHFTYMNDLYYLWFSTHARTFQGDLEDTAPDGLYGFVGANINGPFYPLNDTGLVLANPAAAPKQLYSFSVEKTSETEVDVLSFIFNYIGGPGDTEFSYGGTPAPILSLKVEGDQTALSYIPAPRLDPARVAGDTIINPYQGFDPAQVGFPTERGAAPSEQASNRPTGSRDNSQPSVPSNVAGAEAATMTADGIAMPSALRMIAAAAAPTAPGAAATAAQTNALFTSDTFGIDPIDPQSVNLALDGVERLPFGFEGWYMSSWLPESLQKAEVNETNQLPLAFPPEENIIPGYRMRDPAPVRTLDGQLARINGYYMLFGETSLLGAEPDNPTGFLDNTFRFAISKDGKNWEPGSVLLDPDTEGVVGQNLFAGSARYDPVADKLYIFYTGVTENFPSPETPFPQPKQVIGLSLADPVLDQDGKLAFANYDHKGMILEADGEFYSTAAESSTFEEVYGFRDPWPFIDPRSGDMYMTFVGNLGDQDPRNDGVVGLARATNADYTEWELLPPIFGAPNVNTQLELPEVIYQDDLYYLFFTTHDFTFINDLQNEYPEGLYGFVAPNLWGPYYPLNDSGLVLSNPQLFGEETGVEQQYAFRVAPAGDGTVAVYNFLYGAKTEGPLLRLLLDGDRTAITSFQPPQLPTGPFVAGSTDSDGYGNGGYGTNGEVVDGPSSQGNAQANGQTGTGPATNAFAPALTTPAIQGATMNDAVFITTPTPTVRDTAIATTAADGAAVTQAVASAAYGIDPTANAGAGQPLVRNIADYPISFDGAYSSLWSRDQAMQARLEASNTLPFSFADDTELYPGFAIADYWPVRLADGDLAQINGYYVIVGLFEPTGSTTEANTGPELRYLVSRDGDAWLPGGVLIGADSDGLSPARISGGSAVWNPGSGTLRQFLTTAGTGMDPSEIVMAMAAPTAGTGVPQFAQTGTPMPILQSGDPVYAVSDETFDDPEFFRDPRSGRSYLTFSAQLADNPSPLGGVIGLAVATDDMLDQWQALPPLVAGIGTAAKIEQPQLAFNDGRYSLFASLSSADFGDSWTQPPPSGLYGWTAPNLWGPYLAYNGSGLVLGNPAAAGSAQLQFTTIDATDPGIFRAWGISNPGATTSGGMAFNSAAPIVTFAANGRQTALTQVPWTIDTPDMPNSGARAAGSGNSALPGTDWAQLYMQDSDGSWRLSALESLLQQVA